ncbi:MAG: site-specific DNA-methyltransferase [Acidobacteria bacterium]|nr:site-specific DNA-methyltransferase [Acidobacteriota bacterium]MCI0620732.1 site-specific DNA-methyltransferase [Acidobacteriota bacterium]MCI0719709.1 site-specific DNA-methyltransferase [Acidobacteriota bacterium]
MIETKPNGRPAYETDYGAAYCGDSRDLLKQLHDESISLVITSPPFALQRKKDYGNKDQHEYVDWLAEFGEIVYSKLRNDGSFVLDLGGAYQKAVPVRSLYNFRVLIRFCDDLGFHLAEEFFWYNPSRLPSPIEWVNKRKLRAKDSVNTIWWFSKTAWPKADISRVLVPYSERMKKLIEDPEKFYRPMVRPSGHDIGSSFGKDNGGAIPSNLLQLPNSESNGLYLEGCKSVGTQGHPARFPARLPEFFIQFLTDPGDLVVDIFAGSNTTGQMAESHSRRWLAFDERLDYLATSAFRFLPANNTNVEMNEIYKRIMANESVDLREYLVQQRLQLFETPRTTSVGYHKLGVSSEQRQRKAPRR